MNQSNLITFNDMSNCKKIFVLSIFLVNLGLVVCFGQINDTSLKILGLTVEGNDRTDSGLIIATSGFLIGEHLSGDKVQNAIRQLWKLDLFADIKILVEEQTSSGVFMTIRVRENPRLELIEISGAKKIGKDEVDEAVNLHQGQVLRSSDPVLLERKLKKLAEDKGYLLADIDIRIRDGSEPGLAELHIRIHPGTKVKIKDILFDGNQHFSDKKLRKQLKETKRKALFRSGEFQRDEFEEDLTNLIRFYREHGYRDAQVLTDSTWYTENLKRLYLYIQIDEGNQYYFGNIKVAGSDLYTEAEHLRQLLFRPGDVFNQARYELSLSERLSTMYYDRGYIYVNIVPTEIPAGGDTLDIKIDIIPGNRFSVRNINITGNTKTREKVVRREFVLKPGDTFDVTKLRRSIREVAILNYFADVQPDVEDVSDDEIDLWIGVEERATDQANLSAGYSERDGMIGSIGFAAPNLFGTGQQLSFDWNFGNQYGSFSVSYTEPWFFDTETLVGGSFYLVRRRWNDGFTEKLIGGSTSLGRRFIWPDDYFRGDWVYRIEQSTYDDISEDLQARIESSVTQLDTLTRISSTITQVLSRDSRDYPEFPTSGSVYRLTTELAGGVLGGDDRYHKHIVSLDWYTPLIPKLVLFNQGMFGYLESYSRNSRDIPLLEYFYMGGSGLTLGTPLRGYEERTVGPTIQGSRTAAGGRTQFKISSELRLQLVDNPTIYTLLFAESGNTYLNFKQTDIFDQRRSWGLGIRLFMPMIGLIGLDYGYGMDFDASGRKPGWTPHFQFGRYF